MKQYYANFILYDSRSPAVIGGNDEPILPLINVVFLLLIFFMISSRFTEPSPFDMDPAQATAAAKDDTGKWIIYVSAQGDIALGDRQTTLEKFDQTWALTTGDDIPDNVQIQADAASDVSLLLALLERLRKSGTKKVQLRTLPRS